MPNLFVEMDLANLPGLTSKCDSLDIYFLGSWDYRNEPLHLAWGVVFFFLVGLGFELGLCTCKEDTFLLEPHLQSVLVWLFWRWGSLELFAWAGLEPPSSQSQPLK
jgi:hypothetical protein